MAGHLLYSDSGFAQAWMFCTPLGRELVVLAKCRLALPPARSRSLLAERANRVNPRGSQRWDQAREYRDHNQEQRCPRYAHRVGWTDVVKQRRDLRGRCQGEGEVSVVVPRLVAQ